MATMLDPRTKMLYRIEDYELEGLWIIVSRRAVEIAGARQAGQAGTTVSLTGLGIRRTARAASTSASVQRRTSFMAASMAHAGKLSSASSPLLSKDNIVECAVKQVKAFKHMPPLPLVENVHNHQEIFPGPLQWVGIQGSRLPYACPASLASTGDPCIAGSVRATLPERWLDHDENAQCPKLGQCRSVGLPT